MTPGAALTPEVLAAAIERVRRKLLWDVAYRAGYGELMPTDGAERLRFAREVVAELGEMERGAAPHVIEGEEPTEASGPPRAAVGLLRRTTRARVRHG